MISHRAFALLSLLILLAGSVWLIRAMQPPPPLPADAPATDFSAKRAFAHVEQIAREPHAIGTPAHDTVQAYLLDQLRRLNLNPQVQETTVAHRNGGKVGYVSNLMGRIRGQNSTGTPGKAVLMLAHYDSQPNSRGAADDGSGVAAILETARALQQGPPLQNDVIFLLTDGEEYGLFGAQAFIRHPWARDVGFVMNVEARGVSGPSMTFEISPQNGWAVEAFGAAAPYPLASSLMYEIYRSLPNNTDFTVFRLAGYSGINSAFIDGLAHYHKLTDSPEQLDLGTLQHQGSNLLAMARYVGNQSLAQTKAPDKVFFNTVGFHFVQYPMSLNGWLLALLTLILVGTVVEGRRKGAIGLWPSFAGAGVFLVLVLVVTGLFWPITVAVRQLLPPAFFLDRDTQGRDLLFNYYINGIYGSNRFLIAYALLAAGLFGLLTRLVLTQVRTYRARPFSLVMGVYGLLYALVVVQFIRLPATMYLLLFPLLFSCLGTWVVFRWKLYERTRQTGLSEGVVTLLAALPTLTLIPLVWLLFVTFDLQLPIIASIFLLLLALGLLLPAARAIDQPLRWRNWSAVPLGALVLGLCVTGWAIGAEQPGPQQPIHSQVSYYLDADSARAYWASESPAIDAWKRQFFAKSTTGLFPEFYPASQRRRLKNEAPVLALPAPTATIVSDSSTDSRRQIRLRLTSVRGAAGFEIGVISADSTAVQAMTINDEPIKFTRAVVTGESTLGGYQFFTGCNGLPASKTITLTITARPKTPFRLLVFDESMTLPPTLIRVPRPANVVFEQGQGSNQTVVRKSFQL